jgi:hypothetical protein
MMRSQASVVGVLAAGVLACAGCSSNDATATPTSDAAVPDDAAAVEDAPAGETGRLAYDGAVPDVSSSCNGSCKKPFQLTPAAGTPCTLTWPAGTTFDPAGANVELLDFESDGGGAQIVPMDAANGWTYDDPNTPTKIALHGSACTLLEGAAASVKVEMLPSCPAVPPVC